MYDAIPFCKKMENFYEKRPELFTIGEIAQAVGVTRRIILNYEERGLISPDIKDESAGNRYYTVDTFTKIRSIRSLQNLGLSLDEIRGYFDDTIDLLPLIRRLVEYAKENGFTPLGTLRHVYLEGPPQHKDPSKFITQVVLPIEDTDGRR